MSKDNGTGTGKKKKKNTWIYRLHTRPALQERKGQHHYSRNQSRSMVHKGTHGQLTNPNFQVPLFSRSLEEMLVTNPGNTDRGLEYKTHTQTYCHISARKLQVGNRSKQTVPRDERHNP